MKVTIFLSPQHITHVRIDESVEVIEGHAFDGCENLVYVETHNGLRKIGEYAFCCGENLPRLGIKSVIEIDEAAFFDCDKLQFVEFGDKLELIGENAFSECRIGYLKLLSVVTIEGLAFSCCERLIDVEFSEKLERVSSSAFNYCVRLQRIVIPLKRNLFEDGIVFSDCVQLARIDLIGGVHQTVASLHMESWKAEMASEINRINQLLLEYNGQRDNYDVEKTRQIRQWMDSVIDRLDYYKAEHTSYVKEGMTLLELALWKAKLAEKEDDSCEESEPKKAKIDVDDERKESRVTCGADTVIKNVSLFSSCWNNYSLHFLSTYLMMRRCLIHEVLVHQLFSSV